MISKTVTRNNQVTIPKKLADRFGIREGSRVFFNEENGRIFITKNDPSFWDNVPKCLPDDVEEILTESRRRWGERSEALLKRHARSP